MHDGAYWAHCFKEVFAKQITLFCAAVETRFLPTFDSLESEARRATEAEWNRSEQRAVGPDGGDECARAEEADEAGVDYYLSMRSIRQTLLNLAVAALYHLFEQQLLYFHRRQILPRSDEDNVDKISICKLRQKLSEQGISIEKLPSWPKIEELRVVANTIKHAEGRSAARVRELRPDLFTNPLVKPTSRPNLPPNTWLYMPLAGEDIFLTVTDLNEYQAALLGFWEELGAAILTEPDVPKPNQ